MMLCNASIASAFQRKKKKEEVDEKTKKKIDPTSYRRTIYVNTNKSKSLSKSKTKEQQGLRRIGYSLVEAKRPRDRRNVIVWFYPLSGSTAILEAAASSLHEQVNPKHLHSYYQASVLMVDRPGIGNTEEYYIHNEDINNTNNPVTTNRNKDNDINNSTDDDTSSSSSMSSITEDNIMDNSIKNKKNKAKKASILESILRSRTSCYTDTTTREDEEERTSKKRNKNTSSSWTSNIDRIQAHARDVMHVLQHHSNSEIQNVYIVGVCIGHVFALEFAKLLMTEDSLDRFTLRAMALQAPFVSTMCSKGWRTARLGAVVPSWVLNLATHSMSSIGSILLPYAMTPQNLESHCIIPHFMQEEFGWKRNNTTDDENTTNDDNTDDLKSFCMLLRENHRRVERRIRVAEAQLGVDPSWQTLVCDQFAKLYNSNANFPITIYACRSDPISTWESIHWYHQRCYSNKSTQKLKEEKRINTNNKVTIIEEKRVINHELMTCFGGPPRNPVLLHEIVNKWGLLLK